MANPDPLEVLAIALPEAIDKAVATSRLKGAHNLDNAMLAAHAAGSRGTCRAAGLPIDFLPKRGLAELRRILTEGGSTS